MTDRELYAAAYVAYIANRTLFRDGFDDWIWDNLDFYRTFEAEALKVASTGRKKYAARTIVEYLRHWSAIKQVGSGSYKLNDHWTPSAAQLFRILNPTHADFFEFRKS